MTESIFERIVSDLRAFLRYLASLWGLLTAFSAFFPLINNFYPLIRLPTLNPDVCVLLSTLVSIYVVFSQFTNRKELNKSIVSDKGIASAVAITLIYLILPFLPDVPPEAYANWYLSMPWARFLISFIFVTWSLVEPALYILIFYSFTRLFSALAVKEWQTREKERNT